MIITSLNTTQKGNLAELQVLARLLADGKTIALPFGNQHSWDLLFEENGQFLKVQVKTAYRRNGRPNSRFLYVSGLRGGGTGAKRYQDRKYKEGEFDVLIVVDLDSGEMWKLPAKNIIQKHSLALTDEYLW